MPSESLRPVLRSLIRTAHSEHPGSWALARLGDDGLALFLGSTCVVREDPQGTTLTLGLPDDGRIHDLDRWEQAGLVPGEPLRLDGPAISRLVDHPSPLDGDAVLASTATTHAREVPSDGRTPLAASHDAALASWVFEGDEPAVEPLYPATPPHPAPSAARGSIERINPAALRFCAAVTAAAHAFTTTVYGTPLTVRLERTEPETPSHPIEGLPGLQHLPSTLRLSCRWEGGGCTLRIGTRATLSRRQDRHRLALAVHAQLGEHDREIVWTSVAGALLGVDAEDEATLPGTAYFRTQRHEPERARAKALSSRLKELVTADPELPMATPWNAALATLSPRDGAPTMSAPVVYRRLVRLALYKLWFLLRNETLPEGLVPLIDLDALDVTSPDDAGSETVLPRASKRRGLRPFPGGNRDQVATVAALLERVVERADPGLERDELRRFLEAEYGVDSSRNRASILRLLQTLDFIDVDEEHVRATEAAASWVQDSDPQALFDRMHRRYLGLLELLVLADRADPALGTTAALDGLNRLLDVDWKTSAQSNTRRNWLLSMGLLARTPEGDTLTPAGAAALERWHDEVPAIQARLEHSTDEGPGPSASDDTADPDEADDLGVLEGQRVDLTPASVQQHAERHGLVLPPGFLDKACAALSAGKHLLLTGPPGTAKTQVARMLAEAAQADTICEGWLMCTASADWTSFDTLGGYAMDRSGALSFREGVFLRALTQRQWLILDEINRADLDSAFGELMTVLAGHAVDTPYTLDDERTVRIASDASATHRVFSTFRLIGTMNDWDKTSLFALSYAVQRRFAILHLGIPEASQYRELVQGWAQGGPSDTPLPDDLTTALCRLFSPEGLLSCRPLGPALARDLCAFLRRRLDVADSSDATLPATALAEGLEMYVVPQLAGMEQKDLEDIAARLAAATETASTMARRSLRRTVCGLAPHLVPDTVWPT